ncbi:MAG TPA: histidine kinase, partial [Cyclobacteriaceae bacterium]|nr:histidine kinase [Cyclobacteriaceae bacterium]
MNSYSMHAEKLLSKNNRDGTPQRASTRHGVLIKVVTYHLRILLSGVAITLFFNFLWSGHLTIELWPTLVLVFVQLEIFMVIARKLFPRRLGTHHADYRKVMIVRLSLFFVIIFLITSAFALFTMDPPGLFSGGSFSLSPDWKMFLISWIIALGAASAGFFYLEWTNALDRERQLREEKLIFRYETLKNQVNPHFLFNCLNTLSGLIPKDALISDQFISKLAATYRYILEYSDRQWVSLSDELAFVKDHFFLQEIRDAGKVEMEIRIESPAEYVILPISLQLLVENALKHNIATLE